MTEHQFTAPGTDDEPDSVALDLENEHITSPEETAMHIEEAEEGGGRVDRPGDGYLEDE